MGEFRLDFLVGIESEQKLVSCGHGCTLFGRRERREQVSSGSGIRQSGNQGIRGRSSCEAKGSRSSDRRRNDFLTARIFCAGGVSPSPILGAGGDKFRYSKKTNEERIRNIEN